jgi:hypothetical protein
MSKAKKESHFEYVPSIFMHPRLVKDIFYFKIDINIIINYFIYRCVLSLIHPTS